MRALITGGSGLLGSALAEHLKKSGWEVFSPSHCEMDITVTDEVEKAMEKIHPEIVFHCAAYTDVARAELEEARCRQVNAEGTKKVAEACRKYDSVLVYVSTDYVFPGEGDRPYRTDDAPAPLNVYGQTKYEGEQEVRRILDKYFIVRVSWLFGENGVDFVDRICKKAANSEDICAVDDQAGAPTYAGDLAPLLADLAVCGKYGIYHASNEGVCTWYEFAETICRKIGSSSRVRPVSSDAWGNTVKRPHNSRLDKSGLDLAGVRRLPEWEDALERYLEKREEERYE